MTPCDSSARIVQSLWFYFFSPTLLTNQFDCVTWLKVFGFISKTERVWKCQWESERVLHVFLPMCFHIETNNLAVSIGITDLGQSCGFFETPGNLQRCLRKIMNRFHIAFVDFAPQNVSLLMFLHVSLSIFINSLPLLVWCHIWSFYTDVTPSESSLVDSFMW